MGRHFYGEFTGFQVCLCEFHAFFTRHSHHRGSLRASRLSSYKFKPPFCPRRVFSRCWSIFCTVNSGTYEHPSSSSTHLEIASLPLSFASCAPFFGPDDPTLYKGGQCFPLTCCTARASEMNALTPARRVVSLVCVVPTFPRPTSLRRNTCGSFLTFTTFWLGKSRSSNLSRALLRMKTYATTQTARSHAPLNTAEPPQMMQTSITQRQSARHVKTSSTFPDPRTVSCSSDTAFLPSSNSTILLSSEVTGLRRQPACFGKA